ncbi:MAG: nucleoside triphosphate pyrophosphohydrolase [Patescibacteria group bacterium]
MTKTLQFGKLVRDNIPEIIIGRGESATWHVADDAEYDRLLREKLSEEVAESLANPSLTEFAVVLEVIDAMAQSKGSTFEDVLKAKHERAEKRGGFTKRMILDTADEMKP